MVLGLWSLLGWCVTLPPPRCSDAKEVPAGLPWDLDSLARLGVGEEPKRKSLVVAVVEEGDGAEEGDGSEERAVFPPRGNDAVATMSLW